MSKSVNILAGESAEEFDALSAQFHAEFQPATETERMLVDMMVQHEWLMRRAVRMQQALLASVADESQVDPKRLSLVVRYYRTHERGAAQAKRELETMRKYKRKTDKAVAASTTRQQRQWEQILKEMPTLTNWVN
jgi:ribulose kinase